MRVLYVLPYVPSLIRVRSYNIIRDLAQRHEIVVLATGRDSEREDAERLKWYCDGVEFIPLSTIASAKSCAAAALRGDPLQSAVCMSPRVEQRLKALLVGGGFDLVHVEHLRAAHLGAFVPRDIPTLYDSVDCISLLWERTLRGSDSLRQRVVAALELARTRAYEARVIGRFDRVTATSPDDARALRALAPAVDVAVVPNGVDLDYFRPITGLHETATIVFSGKMSYHANVTAVHFFARQILPLIRRVKPDVRVRIVGSSPPRSILALARDPAISVTGHLPDIRDALGRGTVAVCPVTVKVGIQNKVLEAMAMGLPVVCTAEGAEGLMAEPERDFLVARSPEEFAGHVCRVLEDAELRGRLGRAGRHHVERYHRWDVASQNLETLYREALDRRIQRPGPEVTYGSPVPRARLW